MWWKSRERGRVRLCQVSVEHLRRAPSLAEPLHINEASIMDDAPISHVADPGGPTSAASSGSGFKGQPTSYADVSDAVVYGVGSDASAIILIGVLTVGLFSVICGLLFMGH